MKQNYAFLQVCGNIKKNIPSPCTGKASSPAYQYDNTQCYVLGKLGDAFVVSKKFILPYSFSEFHPVTEYKHKYMHAQQKLIYQFIYDCSTLLIPLIQLLVSEYLTTMVVSFGSILFLHTYSIVVLFNVIRGWNQ